jgi:hypothetical protein
MPDLTTPPTSTPGLNSPPPRPALSEEAELEQFIATHGLRADLDKAVTIARESFPQGSQVVLRLQYSPEENGGAGLVVEVKAWASVSEGVRCHQQLVDRWTRELPLRAQSLIGATFSIS